MSSPSQHERHMRRCIDLARQAVASGDAPVGSLILDGDELRPKASKRCVLAMMRRLMQKWRHCAPRLSVGVPAI
jgi:hypothetical protein